MKKKTMTIKNNGPQASNHVKLDKDVKEFIKACSERTPDPFLSTWAHDLLRKHR